MEVQPAASGKLFWPLMPSLLDTDHMDMVHVLGHQDELHQKPLHVELTVTPVLPIVKAFRKVIPSRNKNSVLSKESDDICEEAVLNHAWFQGSWRSIFWA